jgi:hypothetical protein
MMKRTKFLIVLALLGASVSFWQCGSDPAPAANPQDEQLTKLSQTWKATAVTFNSTPVGGYTPSGTPAGNFQITMSGTPGQSTFNYTVTGRPAGVVTPWPASGTFTFGTDFATVIIRNDGSGVTIPVTYSVSATQLQMTFTYDCPTCTGYTGKTTNVNGNWSFTFGL